MYYGVVDEVERPHVVDASRVVLVLVREQYRIYMRDSRAEHLIAEVGPGVDNYPPAAVLDHGRGAQPLVTAVRPAAPYYGHALRGTRTEERNFHGDKITTNSPITRRPD